MKFWENHAKEMRKARLLQAAAVIFTVPSVISTSEAVKKALNLEKELERQLEPSEPNTRN